MNPSSNVENHNRLYALIESGISIDILAFILANTNYVAEHQAMIARAVVPSIECFQLMNARFDPMVLNSLSRSFRWMYNVFLGIINFDVELVSENLDDSESTMLEEFFLQRFSMITNGTFAKDKKHGKAKTKVAGAERALNNAKVEVMFEIFDVFCSRTIQALWTAHNGGQLTTDAVGRQLTSRMVAKDRSFELPMFIDDNWDQIDMEATARTVSSYADIVCDPSKSLASETILDHAMIAIENGSMFFNRLAHDVISRTLLQKYKPRKTQELIRMVISHGKIETFGSFWLHGYNHSIPDDAFQLLQMNQNVTRLISTPGKASIDVLRQAIDAILFEGVPRVVERDSKTPMSPEEYSKFEQMIKNSPTKPLSVHMPREPSLSEYE